MSATPPAPQVAPPASPKKEPAEHPHPRLIVKPLQQPAPQPTPPPFAAVSQASQSDISLSPPDRPHGLPQGQDDSKRSRTNSPIPRKPGGGKSPNGKGLLTASPALSGSKSRKSSCDLCHHRKIRCDQARPSCGSCHRKGHVCHYSEETEQNNSSKPPTRAPSSVTIVPSSNQIEKGTVPVPVLPAAPPAPRVGPEWSALRTKPKAEPKEAQRERILNGFDSSDDESTARSVARSVGKSVGGELADLAAAGEEVDELDSGNEELSGSVSSGKRREQSADDELAGELLELASGPPKKKKPRPSGPPVVAPLHRPVKPAPRPRASLPAAIPPTPASASNRVDHYATPIQALLSHLPTGETQTILFNTFFTDPFLTEGISLLQPQYLEDFRGLLERRGRCREGDATTLAAAFAFLAVALRILPEETSRLLLASTSSSGQGQPRSLARILVPTWPASGDTAPLDQRYFDLAILVMQIADQYDMPSVMLVMCKLTMVRFVMMRLHAPQSGPMALAGGWLAHAIKIAHTLGMGKEWEGIPQGERELRRRVMWSLYNTDRHWSLYVFKVRCANPSLTANPYTILDAHQGIHLPSPISEADLYKIPADASSLPPHSTEVGPTTCTALFIHTHLARRITPILDSFATVSPSNTPHDLVLRFDASLDAFQEALPPYFRLFPQTDTHWDSSHPYLAAHRVRLHATLLGYRMGVHRAHLPTYLLPITPPNIRAAIAQVCLSTLRVQRSAKMLDPKVAPRVFSPVTVFESAATLGLIMYVEKALGGSVGSEMMVWRGGVAEAGELLDNVVSPMESAAFARRAVTVVREIMVKVDAPIKWLKEELAPNGDDHSEQGQNGDDVQRGMREEKEEARAAMARVRVTGWMERLLTEGMNMNLLLREPEWEGGWEKIILGMGF